MDDSEKVSRSHHESGPKKSAYECLFGLPGPAARKAHMTQAQAPEERARQSSTQAIAESTESTESTFGPSTEELIRALRLELHTAHDMACHGHWHDCYTSMSSHEVAKLT